MKIELIEVFKQCAAENNIIRPPKQQLDAKLYSELKSKMTQNRGAWKGGNKQYFEFEFNAGELLEKLRNGEDVNLKQDWHFFPTPPRVVEKMFDIEMSFEPRRILEPSAGRGGIVTQWQNLAPFVENEWFLIEPEPGNRKYLLENNFNLIHDDFTTYEVPEEKFDLVLANPPFFHDRAHVAKMFQCVRNRGSVLCVLPCNFESKNKALIESERANFEHILFYKNDDRAFKSSGTMVDTVIMHAYSRNIP